MSEPQAQPATPLPDRQALIDAAAAAAQETIEVEAPPVAAAPTAGQETNPALTPDDVAGTPSERKLVAPGLREFLRAQQAPAEPDGLEKEISDLRGALDGLANPQTPQEESVEIQTLKKLEALETRLAERDAADAQAKEEEEYNNRVRTMREGVTENIRAAKDKYPAIVALGQEETVFNVLAQLGPDSEDSEDDVASEIEQGLRKVYDTLSGVFGSAPSKDQPTSERKQTLTTALAGTESEPDVDNMSRAEKIEYFWNKSLQS